MKTNNFKLVSKFDGLPLDALLYLPDEFDEIVVFAHGMAEYKERYLPFIEYLANHNVASLIYDHRGHGGSVYSKKDFGYFYDEQGEAIVLDTLQALEYVKEEFENKKIILFGHSMGSLVVRCALKRDDTAFDKLVVCGSPSANKVVGVAIGLVKAMMAVKGDRYKSSFIANLAMGSYQKAFKDEGLNAWLASDPNVAKRYNQDEKCGFTFTLNGFLNLFTLMDETYKRPYHVKNENLPILFVAGENDPCIVSKEAFLDAQAFLKNEGYKQIDAILYPTMRHEILNELNKEKVYEDLLNWIKK